MSFQTQNADLNSSAVELQAHPSENIVDVSNFLLEGIKEGYSVKITYNGTYSSGKIESMNYHCITLLVQDDRRIRIRNTALDSVELLDTNEKDTILSVQEVDVFFSTILELSNINKESLIQTNSTITGYNKNGFTVITDSGEIVECIMPGIVGYKKKECTIGKRVYCGKSSNGKCYASVVEMSYRGLIDFFHKAISYNKKITKVRSLQIMSILTFLSKEFPANPEAYLEIRKFRKKIKTLLGQINEDSDVVPEHENQNNEDNKVITTSNIAKTDDPQVFKTETEKQIASIGYSQLKIVGKIDLDNISGVKKITQDKSANNISEDHNIEKPIIITSKVTTDFLNRKLTKLSDSRCKIIEKELDTLIRNGEKEECLNRSYQIINTSRPTPKYLKSYLDRIVNTEIALEHTEDALQALAYLIAFSEQQEDTSTSSMGHLYITMARLFLKERNKEEALKAIKCAENLKPNNNTLARLKDSILLLELNNDDSNGAKINSSLKDTTDKISNMLLQDVEQEAHRLEMLPDSESTPAEQLFGKAQNQRNNESETYEDRASLFLEAAAAYYNNRQTDSIMFKISVANYARLKGHSMFIRFSNLIDNNELNVLLLQAYCDSACSYYLEALSVFNTLGEKHHLQELLLKYMQLHFVVSQIKGGKTPDPEWNKWTLKQLQQDCLNNDSVENIRTLLSTYITVGSTAEGAWNTLAADSDGTGVFTGKCTTMMFRKKIFDLFNDIEQSNIENNSSISFNSFIHQIFSHRRFRVEELNRKLHICSQWPFSAFDILTFETIWADAIKYKELMTTTDQILLDSITEIIAILKPYAGRKEYERTRLLVQSQQILLTLQKMVIETTTFYGKTFFSHLASEWLGKIAQLQKERYASTYPKLEITPEPCYIRTNNEGLRSIDFVVTNNGDSTAQSFVVMVIISGKEYMINHNEELPAGDCCGESVIFNDSSNEQSLNVVFELKTKYQGKDLPTIKTEATYEVESEDVLADDIKLPWTISNTPQEYIFKGRDKVLKTLVDHYLSRDRSRTYILYGLTRTGKSSILHYLRSKINGQFIKESPNNKILTFKWNLNESPYKNSTSSQFWTWALETNIYDRLSDELADKIDAAYDKSGLPPAENLSQLDFTKIVDVLNNNHVIPLITIDEFSFVRHMLKEGLIDATFIATLRNLALEGKACFVYAGTYEIKDLPKEKEFGLQGQMTNTKTMHINEIDSKYADELIDACELIIFDQKAKTYIKALSGCVPYWIQWICLECGKYAVAHKRKHLGYNEVNYVVEILTGEKQPSKNDVCVAIDETNFHNNQIDPENIAEHQLISSISYLNRESTQIERGISMDELKRLWDKYNVLENKRIEMTRALAGLKEKRIIYTFTDEGREVYRLNVDLFRRWWFAHHRDLDLEFSL